MRSSLTRNVFRAIIANEPYCITTCSRKLPRWRARPFCPSTVPFAQRRFLFGLGSSAVVSSVLEDKKTPSNIERAMGVLADLVRAQRDQTQLPPVQKITLAFTLILQYRDKVSARLSRSEIYLLTEAFRYIQEHKGDRVLDSNQLSDKDILQALSTLSSPSSSGKEKFRSDSKALAFMLFSELRQRSETLGKADEARIPTGSVPTDTYISILSSTGGAREAWDILKGSPEGDVQKYWLEIVIGLYSEGLEQEGWKALEEMKSRTGDLSVESHELLTTHFAKNASIHATKKVYGQSLAGGESPTIVAQVEMARFCIRNRELSWAQPILANLRSMHQDSRTWDMVLVSSAAQGATADEIALLFDELAGNAIETNILGPTMSNINSLVEYAFSIGNVQAAQEYISIAQERGLQPDSKTFLLQLDYEVKIGDLDRAVSTYDILSSEDPIQDGSDVPVVNSFLRAVCLSSEPSYELVMRMMESISDKDTYLDAETIGVLCKVFLENDELQEIQELLRFRINSYSRSDRARVAQAFKDFIPEADVVAQRAFNAYELFRASFPETPVDERLPIMHSFFNRKRPDLACLVFGHMRQREDRAGRPTPEAYGQCFEGIAKCQDIDGLQMVYNMLKLDLEVEPDTRIRNGMMAAYIACGQPFTAIIDHFWKILSSAEGPTLSSFALALRACETWIPQGAVEARRIIAMIQSWDVEITKEIYDCYIGAIAGQCEFENAIELIEEMENDIGIPPDAFTIGTFYNAIPWQYRKDEVESWAKQAYPELWEGLLKYGEEIDEDWEIRYFKIDRTINTRDDHLYGEGEYDPQIAQANQMLLETPAS